MSGEDLRGYTVPEAPPRLIETTTAWGREETDPCERGTVGCSVRHPHAGPETDCETW